MFQLNQVITRAYKAILALASNIEIYIILIVLKFDHLTNISTFGLATS